MSDRPLETESGRVQRQLGFSNVDHLRSASPVSTPLPAGSATALPLQRLLASFPWRARTLVRLVWFSGRRYRQSVRARSREPSGLPESHVSAGADWSAPRGLVTSCLQLPTCSELLIPIQCLLIPCLVSCRLLCVAVRSPMSGLRRPAQCLVPTQGAPHRKSAALPNQVMPWAPRRWSRRAPTRYCFHVLRHLSIGRKVRWPSLPTRMDLPSFRQSSQACSNSKATSERMSVGGSDLLDAMQ